MYEKYTIFINYSLEVRSIEYYSLRTTKTKVKIRVHKIHTQPIGLMVHALIVFLLTIN